MNDRDTACSPHLPESHGWWGAASSLYKAPSLLLYLLSQKDASIALMDSYLYMVLEPCGLEDLKAFGLCAGMVGKARWGGGQNRKKNYIPGLLDWGRKLKFKNI